MRFKYILYFSMSFCWQMRFLFIDLFMRSVFYLNDWLITYKRFLNIIESSWKNRERLFEGFWRSVFKKPLELNLKLTEAEAVVKIFLAAVYI